eukprot:358692-Chlamydomonas_euryale.AAC.4
MPNGAHSARRICKSHVSSPKCARGRWHAHLAFAPSRIDSLFLCCSATPTLGAAATVCATAEPTGLLTTKPCVCRQDGQKKHRGVQRVAGCSMRLVRHHAYIRLAAPLLDKAWGRGVWATRLQVATTPMPRLA